MDTRPKTHPARPPGSPALGPAGRPGGSPPPRAPGADGPGGAPPGPVLLTPGAPDPSRIERLCVERGLKMTGQRRLIARVLSEAQDHPDVEEVYRRAMALDSRVSVATVYRTVRLLEEKGILERHDFGGGRARYEPTEHGLHHHLIDVDTGRVIEFADPDHEALAQAIAARLGFALVGQRLELFGRRLPEDAAEAEPPHRRARTDGDGGA